MEYFVFLVVLLILYFLVNNHSTYKYLLTKVDTQSILLENKLNKVLKELELLKISLQDLPKDDETNVPIQEDVVEVPIPVCTLLPVEEERVFVSPFFPIEEEYVELQEHVGSEELVIDKIAIEPHPPKPSKPSFWERNPDLEKFIGENLINKIGIAILVLGIGFFVKYAIDQEWINEIGRVGIGILCGGLLIGIAHRLRTSFKAFSSVLVGGGLAIFYFTITIAFQDYHIFSQVAAFIIMVIITAFAVLLSIAYDRQELAVLAIVGGFLSPLMLSTGSGNYVVMFSYVLILNVGMIVLAYFKKWNLVNISCYLLTNILFASWLSLKVWPETVVSPPYIGAFVFATIFYFIFFLMNIINNLKEKESFKAIEIMILLSNSFLYYSYGMLILKHMDQGFYQGLFTILVALFNFIFAYALYKSQKADKNLVYLLIGLVLTFVSLAAPVQLEGNYITMFWAIEAVLLLWLSQKSGISVLKNSSAIVTVLMLISLIMDWAKIYSTTETLLPILFNKAFITGTISFVSFLLVIKLLRKEQENTFVAIDGKLYATIISGLAGVLGYSILSLELNFQLNSHIENFGVRLLYMVLYNFLVVLLIQLYCVKQKKEIYSNCSYALGGLMVLIYSLSYNTMVAEVRDEYLVGKNIWGGHYFSHYLASALLLAIVVCCGVITYKRFEKNSKFFNLFLWVTSVIVLAVISLEFQNILISAFYDGGGISSIQNIQDHVFQIGYPILWEICSFVAMYVGMRYKIKTFRIISLAVFSITLLKLFIIDVARMSEGGKIAAFISLGVLLLIISFMYQKLKKLIIEDDKIKI